jgi:hypothetical protein
MVTDAPLAGFVARFVARLLVEAHEPFVPGETLRRSTAAVLGQLGVDEARERVEDTTLPAGQSEGDVETPVSHLPERFWECMSLAGAERGGR